MTCHGVGGGHRGALGSVRRQREWEENLDLLLLFLVKRNRQGGVGWLRTGERESFGQVPGCGAVSTCQVPGCGVTRAAEGWPGVSESDQGGEWGSGWVALRGRSTLTGEAYRL